MLRRLHGQLLLHRGLRRTPRCRAHTLDLAQTAVARSLGHESSALRTQQSRAPSRLQPPAPARRRAAWASLDQLGMAQLMRGTVERATIRVAVAMLAAALALKATPAAARAATAARAADWAAAMVTARHCHSGQQGQKRPRRCHTHRRRAQSSLPQATPPQAPPARHSCRSHRSQQLPGRAPG